jgi:ubiquitin-protein ligase
MSSVKSVKRILRDLDELKKEPIDGISIHILDSSNLFELHANILISEGIYKDTLLHVYIHLPNDYPETAPAMNIAKGIPFGHKFHEHVFEDPTNGATICNDMLTNFASFFDSVDGRKKVAATGWSPGCTLKALLMQMTVFFSYPDLPKSCIPTNIEINKMKEDLAQFECVCGHKTILPFPPITFNSSNSPTMQNREINKDPKLEYNKMRLLCGASKTNVIDDDIIIGYPIMVQKTKFGRFTFTPFIEPLSYDSYNDSLKKNKKISVLGNQYTHWLPCYLNKEHFAKCSTVVEQCINNIKYGSAKPNFNPLDALEILSLLMNQTVVSIFNGLVHDSHNLIEGFCHFLQLLLHFMEKYDLIKHELIGEINEFKKNPIMRTKQYVPDIGVFIMKIFLAKYDYNTIKSSLIQEYFARQIFWMDKNHKTNFKEVNRDKRLNDSFNDSSTSNKLYMFLYELFTTCITDSMLKEFDENYGLPDQKIIDDLKNKIKIIKNNINNYTDFANVVQLNDILTDKETIYNILNNAVKLSNTQGYTKNI